MDSFVICHLSFVICHLSFVICHLSFVICHLSFVICHLSFVICHLSFVIGRDEALGVRSSEVSDFSFPLHPSAFILQPFAAPGPDRQSDRPSLRCRRPAGSCCRECHTRGARRAYTRSNSSRAAARLATRRPPGWARSAAA